jgi:hypothetical protein
MSEATLKIPARFYFYPDPDLARRREIARARLVAARGNVDAEKRIKLWVVKKWSEVSERSRWLSQGSL